MSRIIEAKAVITGQDKTGSLFDKVAAKIRGVEKAGKALEQIKAPKFTGNLMEELQRLKLSEKELEGVRKSYAKFEQQLKSGPIRASTYFRAMDDWKSKTVAHWRDIKASVDETEKAHAKFFRSAGRFALIAGGVGSAAYAVNRAARAGLTANATWHRESARDYLAGMSPAESERIAGEARRVSGLYPSVGNSTMHERLRDTAMSMRSTDKAMELSETIAQGTVVLQSLKGKDQAIEEGRKFFAALDVLGKNIDPKEVKELFDGYIKALGVEGADMDLGGALSMVRQARAAGAPLSNRFLMTTLPGLARDLGDPQVGTALSSALSQNVGNRATKQAKAAQQAYGLRDKNGKFLDAGLAMSDPDRYAWEKVIPALERRKLDANDNVAVTKAMSELFSNRVVADLFSKLITQREQYQAKADQYGRAPGLAAAGELPKRDPFVGWEGVKEQMGNLATTIAGTDTAMSILNKAARDLAKVQQAVAKGSLYDALPEHDKQIINALTPGMMSPDAIAARQLQDRVNEKQRMLDRGIGDPGKVRLGLFDLEMRKRMEENSSSMPPLFSQSELDRFEEIDRERRRGAALSSMLRPSVGGVPLPRPRPDDAPAGMPAAQSIEVKATDLRGTVEGETKITVVIEASELLKAAYNKAEAAAKMVGKIIGGSNGPGSTGRSSPDANAPSVPISR